MVGDTTVYVISTGHMPTLAYSKDDFENRLSLGTAVDTPSGTRYRGDSQDYGNIIYADGNMSPARIRGSVAWYEYSTKLKDIRTIMDVADNTRGTDFEERLAAMGKSFWTEHREGMGKKLFHKVMNNIAPKFAPSFEGEFMPTFIAEKDSPKFGDIQTWATGLDFDPTILERDDITLGGVTSVDMYMKHPQTGDIHRFDMSAITLDVGVDAGDNINKNITTNLLSYFNQEQKSWNTSIRKAKDSIRIGTDKNQKEFLKGLENSSINLHELSRQVRDNYGGINRFLGAKDEAMRGLGTAMVNSMKVPIKDIRREAWRAARSTIGTLVSGISEDTIKKMIGNVVGLFSKDSQQYSVGYRLSSKTPILAEIRHKMFGSGPRVFELMDKTNKDITIHGGATHIADIGRMRLNTTTFDNDLIRTMQNIEYLSQTFYNTKVELTGAYLQHKAYDGLAESIQPVHSLMVRPRKDINKDIDNWISKATASEAGAREATEFLKDEIINMSMGGAAYQFTSTMQWYNPSKTFTESDFPWMGEYYADRARQVVPVGGRDFNLADSMIADMPLRKIKQPQFWAAPYIGLFYPPRQVEQ